LSLPAGAAVRVEAPAKVNLVLRILERGADGYHRLETLFQAVGLVDVLILRAVPGAGMELEVRGADVGPPEENLVTRAARRDFQATGSETGLRIVLEKRIPAGAGLGGGSSDAGATLRGLNLLAGEPLGEPELVELGSDLGADVAFFSGSAGLALGEGRGDRIRSLPALPERTLVLGLPGVHVATGPAYGALAEARAGGVPVPAPILEGHGPASWDEVASVAVNDFEAVVPKRHPDVADALAALRGERLPMALLSGSGAAVFGLVPQGADPGALVERLEDAAPACRWLAVPTLASLPGPQRVEPGARIG